ncbi:MAG: lysophospholipid acyltransferase family protein [Terrimicrobiaceae bacterium]|nr:lysophospholipid acyltransferase family protein [Terrimicrobiaceae bacterium]
MPAVKAEPHAASGAELMRSPHSRAVAWTFRDLRNYALQLASLAYFFGGGIAMTMLAPVLRLVLGPRRSQAAGRDALRRVFQDYVAWLQWAGLFRIRCEGIERLEDLRGAIVAPNHPGLLDAVFLIARLPRAVCVMRAGLMRNPCFAGAAWLAGFITNDRGPGLIRDCERKLADGDNLLIFPEGTRTRAHARGVNSFKSGFALAAVITGAPIQTVLIERSGNYLGKETGLMSAARIPIHVTIRLGEVFRAEPGETAKDLSARLETYFRKRLENTDDGVRVAR